MNTKKRLKKYKNPIKNLNTRLSNLKKINKSLDEFDDNSSSLTWEELKNISSDFQTKDEEF